MSASLGHFGWLDLPERHIVAAQFPRLAQAGPQLFNAYCGTDPVLLYKAWTDVLGGEPPYPAQQIGDCLVAGTMVLGETTKPIEDIKVGDAVRSGKGKTTAVISTRSIRSAKPLVRIHSGAGDPIVCTSDHKFYVKMNEFCSPVWQNAERITPRVLLMTGDGHSPVDRVEAVAGSAMVYDIGVEDSHHSFVANGAIVHNCVSFGHAHANDLLQCIEISLGEPADYKETDTEFIYGASREISGNLGNSDGSYGSAAVKAMTQWGMVSREMLGSDGAYDGHRAKQWGRTGPPQKIKDMAKPYLLGGAALVQTWDELVAAITSGYPVTICSNQGFTMTRDQNGFCDAHGHWGHCMSCAAVRFDIEGACVLQSWGKNTPDGPQVLGQPSFSFWAHRQTIEHILSQGDSWAISKSPDFAPRPLPTSWRYSSAA